MTREEIENNLLGNKAKNFILEFATGTGKTKMALTKLMQWYEPDVKILIVIPRNVLIKNWLEEIHKWGYDEIVNNVTFVTYVSLPKMIGTWDIVIFDEAHHVSQRCQYALYDRKFVINHFIGLSATLKREHKDFFRNLGKKKIEFLKVDITDAIEDNILPEPKIILLPLILNSTMFNYPIVREAKKGSKLPPITIPHNQKWKYIRYSGKVTMMCSQKGYYEELTSEIAWYKKKSGNVRMKNIWLSKCGQRLKWLSEQKTAIVKTILSKTNKRVLVFSGSIENSNALGIPCVNSKVGTDALVDFNSGKSDRLSAVEMLTEGMNIKDLEITLFQNINASQRIIQQKQGRSLRHSSPIMIYLYFKGTREEELIPEIVSGFKDVTTYTNINAIWNLLNA